MSKVGETVFPTLGKRILAYNLKFYTEMPVVSNFMDKYVIQNVNDQEIADIFIVPDVLSQEEIRDERFLVSFNFNWLKDLMKGKMFDLNKSSPFLQMDKTYKPLLISRIPDEFGHGKTIGMALQKDSYNYNIALQVFKITGATVIEGGSLTATICVQPDGIEGSTDEELKSLYPHAKFINFAQLTNAVTEDGRDPLVEVMEPIPPIPISRDALVDVHITKQTNSILDIIVNELRSLKFVHYFPMTIPSLKSTTIKRDGQQMGGQKEDINVLMLDTGKLDTTRMSETLEKLPHLKHYGRPEIPADWEKGHPIFIAKTYHEDELEAKIEQEGINRKMKEILIGRIHGIFLFPTETKTSFLLQALDLDVVESTTSKISLSCYCNTVTINTNLLILLKRMMMQFKSSPVRIFQKPSQEDFSQPDDLDWTYKVLQEDEKATINLRNGLSMILNRKISNEMIDKFAKLSAIFCFIQLGLRYSIAMCCDVVVDDNKLIRKADEDMVNLAVCCENHRDEVVKAKEKFSPRWIKLSKAASNLKCCKCESRNDVCIVFLNKCTFTD